MKKDSKTQKKKSKYSEKRKKSNQKNKARKVKSGTKIDPKKVKLIKRMNNRRRARPRKNQRQTGPDDTTCLANI